MTQLGARDPTLLHPMQATSMWPDCGAAVLDTGPAACSGDPCGSPLSLPCGSCPIRTRRRPLQGCGAMKAVHLQPLSAAMGLYVCPCGCGPSTAPGTVVTACPSPWQGTSSVTRTMAVRPRRRRGEKSSSMP